MTPASQPETTLRDLTHRLGDRNREVREAAAQALHTHGPDGLEALFAAWQQEERWEFQRSLIGAAVFLALVGGSAYSLWFHHPTNQQAMWLLFAMIGGMFGATAFMFPTRRRREVAAALIGFEDPRTLPYLAQSLRLITSDDPRRAMLLATLRERLQSEPGHEISFPETKKSLRWQPERTRRPIRLFWFWLCLTLFMAPLSVMVCVFFLGWSHTGITGGVLSAAFGMPLVYTFMASLAKGVLREDVTYTRRDASNVTRWKWLVGAGIVIALLGTVTHFVRGSHPSWTQIAWASLGVPVCWWLSNLAGKRALPEPLPRH